MTPEEHLVLAEVALHQNDPETATAHAGTGILSILIGAARAVRDANTLFEAIELLSE